MTDDELRTAEAAFLRFREEYGLDRAVLVVDMGQDYSVFGDVATVIEVEQRLFPRPAPEP